MNIEKVEKIAKDYLLTTGKHMQQLLIELPDGQMLPMLLAVPKNEEDMLLASLRMFINVMGVERYFFISEAWASKNVFTTPSKDKDREEILVISEFRKDNKNRTIIQYFERDSDNRIVFTKRYDKDFDAHSRFNFFLEDFTDGDFMKRVKQQKSLENVDFVIDEMKAKLSPVMNMLREKGLTEDILRETIANMIKKDKLLIDKDRRTVYMNEEVKNK